MGQPSGSHPRKALAPGYLLPAVAQARAAGARLPEQGGGARPGGRSSSDLASVVSDARRSVPLHRRRAADFRLTGVYLARYGGGP